MLKLITATLLSATPFAMAMQSVPAAARNDGMRVPTSVFGLQPHMQGVRISPDGGKLLYFSAIGGQTALAYLDLATPNPTPKVVASAGEFREIGDRTMGNAFWVGNEHIVVELGSREDIFGQRGDVSRLFAYNVKTGKKQPLAWDGAMFYASGVLDIDHEKGTLLLERQTNRHGTERIGNPEVVRVNVETGRHDLVMRPNPIVRGWAADADGVVRAGFGGDGNSGKNWTLYRSSESDTLKTVTKERDTDFTGAGIQPLLFLPNDEAYVASNKDGYRKIYKTNMRTLELDKPVFERPVYDAGSVVTDASGARLVGFTAVEEGMRYYWQDGTYRQIQQFLNEGFGKNNARIVDSDLREKRFVVFVGAPDQPGAYYLYDTVSGDFKQVGWRNLKLQDRKLNPVQTVKYRASDGQTIHAVVTMPRHRKAKNLPVVMITHGGPFGPRDDESWSRLPWNQAMAELGYVVVQPNYRGSGGYGADWIKKGRNDGFGLRMQDDLNDAITHLAAQGIVDPKRACMMGWSYGGYASARAAQRDPDKWRCAIAGAGVYDLPAMKTYDVNYLGTFGSNYLAKGAADLRSVSPTHNARGKWSPILIVHGVRDQRVPINQARGLVSALKSSGKQQGVDFDYIEQPKNTHNLPYDDVSIEWLEGAERWLAKHNPAYIPSDPDKPVPVSTALAAR